MHFRLWYMSNIPAVLCFSTIYSVLHLWFNTGWATDWQKKYHYKLTFQMNSELFKYVMDFVTKVKRTSGMPFGGAGHLSDHIFNAPWSRLWHYAAELQ